MIISNVENCTVQGNNFINNYFGLFLYDTPNSKILNNTIEFNTEGVSIDLGENLIIANNSIKYSVSLGISIRDSNYTVFEYNTIKNIGGYAIRLDNCNYGNYSNNMIDNSYIGIQGYSVRHHSFTENFIYRNDYYGIRIYQYGSTSNELSADNIFHHNIFISNLDDVSRWNSPDAQAYDLSINSLWYDEITMEGNYWNEYNGSLTYYELDGSHTQDLYPLIVPDSDGDNLDDLKEEYVYFTDKNDNDTDNDELNDYDELFVYDTNPNNPDSDYDGLADGNEILVYKTNALNSDSDGDGLNDGAEVNTYNTDPLDADSDDD